MSKMAVVPPRSSSVRQGGPTIGTVFIMGGFERPDSFALIEQADRPLPRNNV